MKLSELNDALPIYENIEKKRPYLVRDLKKYALSDDDVYFHVTGEDLDHKIDQTIDYIIQSDPVAVKSNGRKTPFVNDIIRWVKKGIIIYPEDVETVRDALAIYNKAKQHGPVRPLSDFSSPGAVRKEYADAEAESDVYEANAKLVAQDGVFKMYQIDDWNQGKICFADSGWCVQHKSSFDDYKPPYFMITKGKKRYALAHIDSQQLKDVEDDPLTMKLAIPIKKLMLKLWPEFGSSRDLMPLAKLWPDGEQQIAKDPHSSYHYADMMDNRFPEGEAAMASDPYTAYHYAKYFVKGRWPEGEKAIATSPKWSYHYADVIKNRFPEGEAAIATDPNIARYYKKFITSLNS